MQSDTVAVIAIANAERKEESQMQLIHQLDRLKKLKIIEVDNIYVHLKHSISKELVGPTLEKSSFLDGETILITGDKKEWNTAVTQQLHKFLQYTTTNTQIVGKIII